MGSGVCHAKSSHSIADVKQLLGGCAINYLGLKISCSGFIAFCKEWLCGVTDVGGESSL